MIRLRLEEFGRPSRTTRLERFPITLGRAPSNDLVLDRPFVSARHGEMFFQDGELHYIDLGSTNGTRVVRHGDGREGRVPPREPVVAGRGDTLVLGAGDAHLRIAIEEVLGAEGVERYVAPTLVVARRSLATVPTAADPTLQAVASFAQQAARAEDRAALERHLVETCLRVFEGATHISVFPAAAGDAGHSTSPDDIALARVYGRRAKSPEPGPPMSATARRAVASAEAVLVADSDQASSDAVNLQAASIRSMMAVPIFSGEAALVQVENRAEPNAFAEVDLELLMLVASCFGAHLHRQAKTSQLATDHARLKEATRVAADREQARFFRGLDLDAFLKTLSSVATSDATILLTGETGAGKEMVARHIHSVSARRHRTFWAVNCAALTPQLLNDELFGHVKGGFTGAEAERRGLFELADGGTLLLDEIGEMELELQTKLLRVLETGEIWPIGSERPRRVHPRILAATNLDLSREVQQGRFRADLYYRLAVFPARVPALRERPRDIEPLARHLLQEIGERLGRRDLDLSDLAGLALQAHRWPGNVRELRNELERAVLRLPCGRGCLEPADLDLRSEEVVEAMGGIGHHGAVIEIPPGGAPLDELERQIFEQVLEMHDGRQNRAAEALGMKYTTFRFRAKKVGAL
ncbi:MAG: sigma 54-interacting transcriptional regulator, partial [Myxococcota bacterium]